MVVPVAVIVAVAHVEGCMYRRQVHRCLFFSSGIYPADVSAEV